MGHQPEHHTALNDSVTYWARFWQQQYEHNLTLLAMMTQSMPHQSARDLAAEAEARKARSASAKKSRAKADIA
jgi:hypothetical protein